MRYVKIAILLIVGVPIVLGLHWSLPSRDIVYIVDTEVLVTERDETAPGSQGRRNVRIIQAIWPDGDSRVYRNEDTGWGFPFYFKFDSDDVQARAASMKSTEAAPRWVVVRHYGWRINWLSMYPNALSIREAEGPDEELRPWFNIVFVGGLLLGLLILYRLAQLMWRSHVDPKIAEIEAESAGFWRRVRRLFGGR